jgi:hypothetical protein
MVVLCYNGGSRGRKQSSRSARIPASDTSKVKDSANQAPSDGAVQVRVLKHVVGEARPPGKEMCSGRDGVGMPNEPCDRLIFGTCS